MAKIPYLPPNNVTLKQIHPVPTTKTITQTLPDGNTVDTVVLVVGTECISFLPGS